MDKEKSLHEYINQVDRRQWGNLTPPTERREKPRRAIDELGSVQKLKLIRDTSVRVNLPRGPITTPAKAITMFREFYRHIDVEVISVMCLNSENEFLGLLPAGSGSINHVEFMPWNIIRVMAIANADSCIVAHNHPSGNVQPSEEDVAALLDIKKKLDDLGHPMRDFMIIGFDSDGGVKYYSHRDEHYDL